MMMVVEYIPAFVACVGLPAYMGALGASPWHFVAYTCVAGFALTPGERLTSCRGADDLNELPAKFGFWVGATAGVGLLPYTLAHIAFDDAAR